MNLKKKRRMIRSLKGVGSKRIRFEPSVLEEIKTAITKSDSRGLIKRGAVTIKQKKGSSRVRARKKIVQKRKGRQKGKGSRKGKNTARLSRKARWMNKIRSQRKLIRELRKKGKITKSVFNRIYRKAKGGFFRSRRHILVYMKEHNLGSGSMEKPEKKNDGVSTNQGGKRR